MGRSYSKETTLAGCVCRLYNPGCTSPLHVATQLQDIHWNVQTRFQIYIFHWNYFFSFHLNSKISKEIICIYFQKNFKFNWRYLLSLHFRDQMAMIKILFCSKYLCITNKIPALFLCASHCVRHSLSLYHSQFISSLKYKLWHLHGKVLCKTISVRKAGTSWKK